MDHSNDGQSRDSGTVPSPSYKTILALDGVNDDDFQEVCFSGSLRDSPWSASKCIDFNTTQALHARLWVIMFI